MEFEPTISAGERPQTYALDLRATGTGFRDGTIIKYITCKYTHIILRLPLLRRYFCAQIYVLYLWPSKLREKKNVTWSTKNSTAFSLHVTFAIIATDCLFESRETPNNASGSV